MRNRSSADDGYYHSSCIAIESFHRVAGASRRGQRPSPMGTSRKTLTRVQSSEAESNHAGAIRIGIPGHRPHPLPGGHLAGAGFCGGRPPERASWASGRHLDGAGHRSRHLGPRALHAGGHQCVAAHHAVGDVGRPLGRCSLPAVAGHPLRAQRASDAAGCGRAGAGAGRSGRGCSRGDDAGSCVSPDA